MLILNLSNSNFLSVAIILFIWFFKQSISIIKSLKVGMYLNNILYLSTIAKKYSFVWLIHLYSACSIQYSDTLQVLMFVCPTVSELLWMLLSLSLFQISPMILGSNSIVKLNRIKKILKMKVVKFSLSSIFFTLPGFNKWM